MQLIRPPRPPFACINGQPSLDWAHPLARGMTSCLLWNQLSPANLAAPTVKTALVSSPTLVPTARGLAGYATGGSSFNIPDQGNLCAADFAVRVLFRPISYNAGGFATLLSKANTNREIGVFIGTTGNVSFVEVGLTQSSTANPTAMAANGGVYDYVITRTGLLVSHYANGVFTLGENMTGVTAQAGAPLRFAVDDAPGGGSTGDNQYLTAQVWNRGLSAGEVLQLYRDPYGFLTYPQDVIRVGVAAAVGYTPYNPWPLWSPLLAT